MRNRKDKLNQALLCVANWLAPKATGNYLATVFITPNRYKRPHWEKNILVDAKRVDLSTGRTVWTWGQDGNPKVCLIHGWEGRGSQLGAFVKPLVEAGYHVFAWDGPAHGDSPGKTTNPVEFSNALKEDLELIGLFEAVVGHSMGAASIAMAMNNGLKVGKAIMIASPARWSAAVHNMGRRLHLRDATVEALFKALERKVGYPIESFDFHEWDKNGRRHESPLLILHDEQDEAVPISEYEKLKELFPKAKGKLFNGLGHRRILKDAEVISAVVKFIKEAA